jgi:AraC family transcriptional regulator, positive regulator of tynA and feaB
MAALERFSTSGLRPRQRVEFWNELCSGCVPAAAQPLNLDEFEPSCTRGSIGELPLSEIHSYPSIVEHSNAHVARMREPLYLLFLQREGTSLHRQAGREAHLRPGDFTLLASALPYQMILQQPNRMLALPIPAALLQRQIASPEAVIAVRMSGRDNLSRMLFDLVSGLWRECAGPGIEGVGGSMSAALLQMIGGAYTRLSSVDPQGPAAADNRRFQVLAYIENNLRDGTLSPASIAARFKCSPRSLHLLFASGPETLSRYILRRRLEESARALTNPAQRARTISDVAFDHGFSSSAHFCKVFREHFELTPTEYRYECLPDQAAGHKVAPRARRARSGERSSPESAAGGAPVSERCTGKQRRLRSR